MDEKLMPVFLWVDPKHEHSSCEDRAEKTWIQAQIAIGLMDAARLILGYFNLS